MFVVLGGILLPPSYFVTSAGHTQYYKAPQLFSSSPIVQLFSRYTVLIELKEFSEYPWPKKQYCNVSIATLKKTRVQQLRDLAY